MSTVLELQNVSKDFKSKRAVDGISLTVSEGSVVALLGPNGAGKSTTVSMMLGLITPTAGNVRLFGKNPCFAQTRSQIGAMLQDVSMIDRLTVKETIELFRSYYEYPIATVKLLQVSGLEKESNQMATQLSGGQQRRLGFALALCGDPKLLFLDEPTMGMDVTSRSIFWESLRDFSKEGKTILLTTHYLEEADAIADEIVLINHGKVVAKGTPTELKASLGGNFVTFTAGPSVLDEQLRRLPSVLRVERSGHQIQIQSEHTDVLLRTLFEEKLDIKNIEVKHGGLDEVFRSLIEDEGKMAI